MYLLVCYSQYYFGLHNHMPIKDFPKPTFCEHSDKIFILEEGQDFLFLVFSL